MGDGNVFVAGQVQAPMDPPAIPQAMRWDAVAGMFRPVSADTAGTALLTGSALLGIVNTAASFQVTAMTLNQGVERFINDSDQANSGGFSFRGNVPTLANRDTKVHVFAKVAGMSAPKDNWAVECKLTIHRSTNGDKTYDPDGTTTVPTGMGGFTYKAIFLPRRDSSGNAMNEAQFLEKSWRAELQFTIPAGDMTPDITSMDVSVGKKTRAVTSSSGGTTLGRLMNWEATRNAPATVTQSPAVTFHIVPFTYSYKDSAGNPQSKTLDTGVVQAAMRSRLLAYLPISQNSLTVDVVAPIGNISWDETQRSGKTLNDPNYANGGSAFEFLAGFTQGIQKKKNEFYFIPIPYLAGRTDSLVLGGTPGHAGGTVAGTHNSLAVLNDDASETAPHKIISVHELLHAHDVLHIDGHSGEAPPFEAFPTVAPYASGTPASSFGMIGVAAYDPTLSGNFDLMTNNFATRSTGVSVPQWISDYTYAKASQYQLSSQGFTPIAAPQSPFDAHEQETNMNLPATAQALIAAAMLSTPSQAQIEETRYVRTGMISLGGGYSPETGLFINATGSVAAYRMVNPEKRGLGDKSDIDYWAKHSEAIKDPTELDKGYTLEIVPEGQPSYRVRVLANSMREWKPGRIMWHCWVPEPLKIKSVRLFKDGGSLGEAQGKDFGYVPEVDLRYDAGKLSWKAPVKAEVMQVVGSDDGRKTWRVYGHGQEKSIPVNLSGVSQWIFAIECVNQDDGRFFRKEIQVKP
jgi:hypothetical protein